MQIRLATTEDIPALVDLAARTFPLACPADMPQTDIEAFVAANLNATVFAEHLASSEEILLVAEARNKNLIGWALLLVDGRDAFLSKCYVDAAAHGTGVADALIDAVLSAARDRGVEQISLGVNKQNARAIGFYRKTGFVVIGERKFKVGSRVESDDVMALDLTEATAERAL